ncbi:pentapeptide repeat-containing protein [Spirillospora sp. CA-108201]
MVLALQQRQHRQQSIGSIGIMFGVLFTAAGLITTALTLRGTQEGQVTDRYTKAVEQLGSPSPEVRLGAVYALERLAGDSARDHNTIMDVLAAYVRVHAPAPDAKTPREPAADVQAALTTLVGNDRTRQPYELDLHGVRIPGVNLASAASNSARRDTHFQGPYLTVSDLRRAGWYVADLRGANLKGADLRHATLAAADLGSSDLRHADLRNAGLHGARLHGADLHGAQLKGADLRGADLTHVLGVTPSQIRQSALTDRTTRL